MIHDLQIGIYQWAMGEKTPKEREAAKRMLALVWPVIAASLEAGCSCSVPEMLSGHKTGCWVPAYDQAVVELETKVGIIKRGPAGPKPGV